MNGSAGAGRKGWRAPATAWALWLLAVASLAATAWIDRLLRRAGRLDLALLHTSDMAPYVLAAVSAATVGAVLASRRPRHPVGWLLLGLSLSVVLSGVATGYANYGLLVRPGALPGAAYPAVYSGVSPLLVATCVSFVLLLTPTGSLPSPRWRWLARVAVIAPLVGLAASALGPFDPPYRSVHNPLSVEVVAWPLQALNLAGRVVTGLMVPAAAASLFVRFRRARDVERLQLRWLVLAAELAAALVIVLAALIPTGNETALGWVTAVCIALLPLATGAAILRYRLYDLNRIISRTVAYGLLTVLLGGGYAAVVLGLGQLMGGGSTLVVAGATLAVAAAFQPLRRRIQRAVDRRFDRRRYDTAHTIDRFSARLRQQIDLDTLTGELLAVVDQTMQPTHVSLWLEPRRVAGGAASLPAAAGALGAWPHTRPPAARPRPPRAHDRARAGGD
jgi:MFS family permease